jgi:hypothetical protein
MEVRADKKNTYMFTLALFFHIALRPVQALVITYDKISQALAVQADVLLPKPFLYFGFDGVVRWKSPASEIFFFQFSKHVEVRGGRVGAAHTTTVLLVTWRWERVALQSRLGPPASPPAVKLCCNFFLTNNSFVLLY